MQPFQRAKLLANLSRKHRAFLEVALPPFAAGQQARWYAAEAGRDEHKSLSGMIEDNYPVQM
jgi:hypothetical protein